AAPIQRAAVPAPNASGRRCPDTCAFRPAEHPIRSFAHKTSAHPGTEESRSPTSIRHRYQTRARQHLHPEFEIPHSTVDTDIVRRSLVWYASERAHSAHVRADE